MTTSTPPFADASRISSRNVLLDAIKEFLKVRGWQQHFLGAENGPCCLGGAFVYVGRGRLSLVQYNDAEHAVRNLVYSKVGYPDFIAWNDRDDRTLADIYDLLDKAKEQPLRGQYDNSNS